LPEISRVPARRLDAGGLFYFGRGESGGGVHPLLHLRLASGRRSAPGAGNKRAARRLSQAACGLIFAAALGDDDQNLFHKEKRRTV